MTKVSVVIPTYNRLAQLKRVLQGLESQTYPREDFEVIVVSDGSSDGTHEYLQTLDSPLRPKYYIQHNQGAAVARNYGVSQAQGEVILFIDDDVVPIPELIQEHLNFYNESTEKIVVIGPMLPPADFHMSPWVQWEMEKLVEQYQDMEAGKWQPTARQFYTGNTSMARRHILEIGGFDPTFRRAEDVELAYRLAALGFQFLFHPGAIGYHYAERSFASWISIPYAYGRNNVIFAIQKGHTWVMENIFEEFNRRSPLIQGLVRLCLDRARISCKVFTILRILIETGSFLHSPKLTSLACGGIFNLRFYQGVCDEGVGRKQFFERVRMSGDSHPMSIRDDGRN